LGKIAPSVSRIMFVQLAPDKPRKYLGLPDLTQFPLARSCPNRFLNGPG
jgi:hypothetical protein